MGYDLHITRAADWAENRGFEITAEEWLALVQQDPELTPDPANGPYAASWKSGDLQHAGWFDWYEGAVYTSDPDPATVGKMVALAAILEGKVQGDEGEAYRGQEDWHGPPVPADS